MLGKKDSKDVQAHCMLHQRQPLATWTTTVRPDAPGGQSLSGIAHRLSNLLVKAVVLGRQNPTEWLEVFHQRSYASSDRVSGSRDHHCTIQKQRFAAQVASRVVLWKSPDKEVNASVAQMFQQQFTRTFHQHDRGVRVLRSKVSERERQQACGCKYHAADADRQRAALRRERQLLGCNIQIHAHSRSESQHDLTNRSRFKPTAVPDKQRHADLCFDFT